jgi:APA family basic amino acid/polyamine antiporter
VTLVTEEIKEPQKNLPKAIFIAIGGITVIYTVFNFIMMKLLPLQEMAVDPLPGSSVSTVLFGRVGAMFITVAILISILGSCNGQLLAFPREAFAMARDKRFFAVCGKVHPKFGTPYVAQLFMMVVSIAILFIGSFEQITVLVVFTQSLFYTMAIVAVFVLRKKYPNLERPYKVFGYPALPAVTVLCAVLLLGNALFEDPSGAILGLIVPLTGIPLYFYFHKKYGAIDVEVEQLEELEELE